MSTWTDILSGPVREVLQALRASTVEVGDSVPPRPTPGHLLIRTAASVVSAGTERMLVEFAQASLAGKARQQPERVREVVEKVRTDGLLATLDAVRSRLEEPLNLGYANAGYVAAVGHGVSGFSVGDLVASNGPHAEFVSVPSTLCAPVPQGLIPEQAAFGTIGAIALQGIRLAQPSLGERFVVTGLGLVGLLAVQLLRAHGCEVIGIDLDSARMKLAEGFGAHTVSAMADPVAAANHFSRGLGVDGVIVTASTSSSEPIHDAARMCRKRGRIVLVGVTGLELQRRDFYEKELTFQVSCSYGPGRSDPLYEDRAIDYPVGYVRWTAGRNIEAVLGMTATQRLDVSTLITHRFPLERAVDAYRVLTDDPKALGIVLEYPTTLDATPRPALVPVIERRTATSALVPSPNRVGVIGAGNFATQVMLPALKDAGAEIVAIAARSGRAGSVAARRFGIPIVTNDPDELFADTNIATIVVLTRHDSHARLVVEALDTGKHVFVEKPLAIDQAGLEEVLAAWERQSRTDRRSVVGIGFNRRFAPITARMMDLLEPLRGPRAVSITVNAGHVPPGHWTQDPALGGGRVIGEGCHFIDLARHLAGSPIVEVTAIPLETPGPPDSTSVTLRHSDGSVSNIGYYANGSKRFPKERITVFCSGRTLVNDNFRRLTTYGWKGRGGSRLVRQDKGHTAGLSAFLRAAGGDGPPPIHFDEIVEVSAATLLAANPRAD